MNSDDYVVLFFWAVVLGLVASTGLRAGWYESTKAAARDRLKRWARAKLLRALAWCDFEQLEQKQAARADEALGRDLAAKADEELRKRSCAEAVNRIVGHLNEVPTESLDPMGVGRDYMLKLHTERAMQMSGAMDLMFLNWPNESLASIDMLFHYADGMKMQGQVAKKPQPDQVAA